MTDTKKSAAEFLGVRVLTPLEEAKVAGGLAPVVDQHDHDSDSDTGHHHDHVA